MGLATGTRLGPYEIVSAIGAGGMGEVYRATDTNLKRAVAIKVLPASVSNDPERLARFQREAEVLASLNHPHIAQIYGWEKSEGTTALVMELVEGEELSQRIARGPIPLDEALPIAKQIAEALEAAHEQGIIHRDLKPANIKVRPDGTVKVLDFGLAKLAESAAPTNPSMQSLSPTITSPALMSGVGVLLGTAAYMSPEQAKGKAADRRSDIWAFGCVLHEMLTGACVFGGETLTDTIAAVIRKEPEWRLLPPNVPRGIHVLIRRCLKKEPSDRWQHISDVRIEIDEAMAEPTGVSSVVHGRRPSWVTPTLIVMAALAGSLLTLVAARSFAPVAPVTKAVSRLDMDLPAGTELYTGSAQIVALSPDGARLAYIALLGSQRQAFIRPLDSFVSMPIHGTDTAQAIFFSPDGGAIAFITADRTLKTVSLSDGLIVTLAHNADAYSGGTWADDGRIIFARTDGGLSQVSASGGPVTSLTTVDPAKSERFHVFPTTLPGGKVLLFASMTTNKAGLASHLESLSLDTGQRRVLVDAGTFPHYLPTGHLVFFRDGGLIAVPFDVDRLQVAGRAVRVADDLGVDFTSNPMVSMSASGSLAYAPGGMVISRLVWVSRQGVEQPLSEASGLYGVPRLAPDGQKIAVQLKGLLWMYDTSRTTFERITSPETLGNSFPAWTADSKRLLLRTRTGMKTIDVTGSAGMQAIRGSNDASDIPGSVSPDGQTLAFLRIDAETSGDIYIVALNGTSPPRPIVKTPAYEGGSEFSPDGKLLAYVSNESGQYEVYLRPFPALDRRWTVSTDGGSFPLWRRDGKELFYRNGNKMMAVEVQSGGGDVSLSAPRMLFDQRYSLGSSSTLPPYDISLDGQRFLMVKDEFGSRRLSIVLNWEEELKRLAPVR